MKIENNILKNSLKHVFWIGGTACSGKTTIASKLSEKYGLHHYDADKMFEYYRSISNKKSQPNLSKRFKDSYEYFSRDLNEYVDYLESINRESFEMLVVDLIKLSYKKGVVVEGHYPPSLMIELAPLNRIALFKTSENIIRYDYFNREDKKSMLKVIDDLSEDLKSHVIDVVVESAKRQLENIEKYNYKVFERSESSTVEDTLLKVEKHFGLKEK